MYQQVDFTVFDKSVSFFYEYPINISSSVFSGPHYHNYGELHFILCGKVEYTVNSVKYTVSGGEGIFIPNGFTHESTEISPSSRFSIPVIFKSKKVIIKKTVSNIKDMMYSGLNGLLFILSDFFIDKSETIAKPNYQIETEYFISRNYQNNITVSDLAQHLNLSENQTERIVKKYTGTTFLKYLTDYRMLIAEDLKKSTDYSLSEISEKVGYKSYAGFYKAMGKEEIEKIKKM